MQIKYKNENQTISISELRSGDVFLWDENAWIILDYSDCEIIQEDGFFCARLSDGYVQRFTKDDYVLAMIQSLLEVKK